MRKFSSKCIREGFDLGILFGFVDFMIDFFTELAASPSVTSPGTKILFGKVFSILRKINRHL